MTKKRAREIVSSREISESATFVIDATSLAINVIECSFCESLDFFLYERRKAEYWPLCFSSFFHDLLFMRKVYILATTKKEIFMWRGCGFFSFVKYMRPSRKRVIFFNSFNRPPQFWIIQGKRFKLQRIKKFCCIIHNAIPQYVASSTPKKF